MFSTGLDLEAGPAQGSGTAQAGGVVQDPLFEYKETLVDLLGPSLPRMEALEGDPGLNYLRHMRSVCQVSLCPHYLAHCSGPPRRLRGPEATWSSWAATGRCRRPWPASSMCRGSDNYQDIVTVYTCTLLNSFALKITRSCYRAE